MQKVAPAVKALGNRLSKNFQKSKSWQASEWRKILAEADVAIQAHEIAWQTETGVVPPRWSTVEELERAIEWWQQNAALAGIDPNLILGAGEFVAQFAPIIRGKLRLLRLQAAATAARHRRPPFEKALRKITERQAEVAQIVGECKGNFAEAGRRLQINPKTARQHYRAAMRKLGDAGIRGPRASMNKLAEDSRGQADFFADDDGNIRAGYTLARRRSAKRNDDE
jgi:DNA-binding CsgD family transcriptional regulator